MEIFSGDFKDIFYDEEAEKRKEKRKERRDELQKAKIPNDYSPNQREINWFLVSSTVGCLFYGFIYQTGINGSRSGPRYQFFTGSGLDNDIFRPVWYVDPSFFKVSSVDGPIFLFQIFLWFLNFQFSQIIMMK